MIPKNTQYGKEPPLYLYKYRSGSEEDIKTLKRKKIFVPDFNHLNDLYENDFSVALETAINNAHVFYPMVFKDQFGEPTFAPVRLESQILTGEGLEKNRIKIENNVNSIREAVFSQGIYSLSHICTNNLMWAHYSNGSRGYCIEYRIPPFNNQSKDAPYLAPVEYVSSPHEIEWSLIDHYSMAILNYYMIGNKPKSWEYELEYRVIYPSGQKEFDIPYEIESIIFGPLADEKLKDDLKAIFGKSVNYKQASKKEKSYDLDVVNI